MWDIDNGKQEEALNLPISHGEMEQLLIAHRKEKISQGQKRINNTKKKGKNRNRYSAEIDLQNDPKILESFLEILTTNFFDRLCATNENYFA